MQRRHRFKRRKPVKRLEPLLAPVPRKAGAAERQFDPAPCPVVVQKNLPRVQFSRHPHLPRPVAGPDRGDQAIVRAIGNRDRLVFVVKRDDHLNRPEYLVLCQPVAGINRSQQRRSHIGTARRCGVGKLTCRDNFKVRSCGQKILNNGLLARLNQRPDFQIIQRWTNPQ